MWVVVWWNLVPCLPPLIAIPYSITSHLFWNQTLSLNLNPDPNHHHASLGFRQEPSKLSPGLLPLSVHFNMAAREMLRKYVIHVIAFLKTLFLFHSKTLWAVRQWDLWFLVTSLTLSPPMLPLAHSTTNPWSSCC